MVENIIGLTSEALENGYNYAVVLDTLRKEYGLSDHELFKIYTTMMNHNWEEDSQYEQFSISIKALLDRE